MIRLWMSAIREFTPSIPTHFRSARERESERQPAIGKTSVCRVCATSARRFRTFAAVAYTPVETTSHSSSPCPKARFAVCWMWPFRRTPSGAGWATPLPLVIGRTDLTLDTHRFTPLGAFQPLGQVEIDLRGAVLPVRQDVGDQHDHRPDP